MKRLAHPAWELDEITRANAARVLPGLAESFLGNGDKAANAEASDARLHGFRLNAKEFRYTLEAFRPLYGPALEGHIARVRRIQTVLGEVNDCRATADLLARYDAVAAVEVERVRQYLEARREELRTRFLEIWAGQYGEARQRQTLLRYLATRVAAGEVAELQ